MTILALIVVIQFILLCFSFPVIESSCALYILMPILYFICGKLNINNNISLVISFLCSFFTLLSIRKLSLKFLKFTKPDFKEVSYIVIFIFIYIFLYILNLSWADFIAMGERFRDYAILSSVISSPIDVKEPWFAGITLNYYAFWYRVGAVLSYISNYSVWNIYHILSAVNTTFFITLVFVITHKHLKFSLFQSLLLSALVFPGSNYNGIKFFFSNDTNWWGPSRVIKGAITEFPTWSFVLGDLHPHFLNLLFFPFIISLLLSFSIWKQNKLNKFLGFFSFLLIPSLILLNANIWDLPIYLALFGGLVIFICILKYAYKKDDKCDVLVRNNNIINVCFLALISLIAIISLYLSSRNIMSVGASVEFVKGEIKRTEFYEFVDAFGVQFFLIFLGVLLLLKNNFTKILFAAMFVFSFFFFNLAVFPIIILLFFNIIRIHEDIKCSDNYLINNKKLVLEVVGMVSFLLWLIPEFIYLKDGYGVENARMNTIFKLYSANFAISFIYVFYLLNACIKKLYIKTIYVNIVLLVISLISILCFFKLINLRKYEYNVSLQEREEGLTELDKMYNGAKNTIRALRNKPKGTVIEGTVGAYNYASHVGTLSGNTSYLGWMNHIGLLYKNYDIINQRKAQIDDFYTRMTCIERKSFLVDNNITYVVLGPLEKNEYKDRLNNDFYCLKNIIQYGEYNIFVKE